MKWLELKIDAAPAGLEPVSALLEDLGITGLVIDDEDPPKYPTYAI